MYTRNLLYPLVSLLLTTQVFAESNLTTSTTGSCGSDTTCVSSRFGNCCSSNSFCGANATYCGAGCQSDFGACYTNYTEISPADNGQCGSPSGNKYTCLGSIFGNCCSTNGFCGANSTYCGAGCQGDYGVCGVSNAASVSIATTVVGAAATASATSSPSASISAVAAVNSSSGLSTGAKAGIGIGVALVALLAVGFIVFFLLRRRKTSSTQTPFQAEMSAVGKHEKDSQYTKIAPSEIGTDGVERSQVVELPTATSHAELPARGVAELSAGNMTEKERIARVDDRAAAGYEGAYRGN